MHTLGRTKHDALQQNAQFSKSKVPCLLRHRGGNYYASAKVAGKVIRRSLETDDFNVAKNRLPGALAEIKGATNASKAATLGAAIEEAAARKDPTIEETTQHYYGQTAIAIAKVAAKMTDNPLGNSISKVSLAELRAMMDSFAATYSASRYNGGLALLRRTYARAVEAGFVATNVPVGLKRLYPRGKNIDLPTAEELASIVADILSQKKRYSKASAAAVEFLAYTRLRVSEAQKIRWKNIKAGWLTTANAKNKEVRQVQLIPAALDLLSRLKSARIPTGLEDPVMLVRSPRIALDNADLINKESRNNSLASIMASLILLHRACLKGCPHAAEIVTSTGVQCAELLSHLLDCPIGTKGRKAAESAALECPEWPIVLHEGVDLLKLNDLVPLNHGKDLGFNIHKPQGVRRNIDFDPRSRVGFAFTYFQDLERARNLAFRYPSHYTAILGELSRQGHAAYAVLFDKHP